jgi:hypothetical protein
MADADGSLMRRAAVAAYLTLLAATPIAAQQIQQPTVAPAPAAPEFFSRLDLHMSIVRLTRQPTLPPPAVDQRFSWDSHFGGSFDIVDYVAGRAGVLVDYQAVMGSEYRPFDPNQGNYTLELTASGRVSDTTEIVASFHHVSRHLSDRPKPFAIAWNQFGPRVLHRRTFGATTLDLDLDVGRVIQRSYVDYTWIGELNVQIRHPINQHVGIFGHSSGQFYSVANAAVRRGTQRGALAEAGVRLNGRDGVMEIYAGYEKRVDADPLDRQPQRWAVIGLRVLTR